VAERRRERERGHVEGQCRHGDTGSDAGDKHPAAIRRGEHVHQLFRQPGGSAGVRHGDGRALDSSIDSTDGTYAFEMASTSGYADGAATTALLTGSGTFVAGKCVEVPSGTSASVTVGVSQYSNFEYCLKARPRPGAARHTTSG